MKRFKENKRIIELLSRRFLFWASYKLNYPLCSPEVLQLNLSFDCNLNCQMCSMATFSQEQKDKGVPTQIDFKAVEKIIPEAVALNVKSVLILGGEPFLHPDLFEIIQLIKGCGLDVALITNGVLLDDITAAKCIESGVDAINISLDAATEEVFSRIRGNKIFPTIISNIKRFNELKEIRQTQKPVLSAICTIMNDNLTQLMDIVLLSQQLEINDISFQPVIVDNSRLHDRTVEGDLFVRKEQFSTLDQQIDQLIHFKEQSVDNFRLIKNSSRHLRLIKTYFRGAWDKTDSWNCYAGYNRMQINQDNGMYLCDPLNTENKSFGDVRRDVLRDLWYSKAFKEKRKHIKQCPQFCMQCCSLDDTVEEIKMLLKRK